MKVLPKKRVGSEFPLFRYFPQYRGGTMVMKFISQPKAMLQIMRASGRKSIGEVLNFLKMRLMFDGVEMAKN